MKALYWIIASFIAVSGLSTMAVGYGKMKKEQPNYISSKESYEGIKNLDIDLGSEDLTVISSADTKVCTVELCEVKESVIVTQDGDTLRISIKPTTTFFAVNTPDSKVIITLPEQELGKVVLDNGSGGISVDTLKADSITVDNGSGGVAVKGAESRIGSIKTGSGGIAIADSSFSENAKLHSGSGGIGGENFAANGTFILDVGSGSVQMDGVTAGKTNATAGSGSLVFRNMTLTDQATFKGGSGDIDLTLTGDPAGYIVSASSGSGETQIEGFSKQKNADAVNVSASSGSGDIVVFYEE